MNYKIDSYTKLLLHMDGADESTTFTDSSDSAHTVTRQGDAKIDTAQKKFGTGSGLFDGTGDYLTVPDHADWSFGTGDFTIDAYLAPNGSRVNQALCGQWVDSNNYWGIYFVFSGIDDLVEFKFIVKEDSSTKASYKKTLFSLPDGVFNHIAIVRDGTSVYLFNNGVSQSLTANTAISTNSMPDLSADLYVGACGLTSASQYVANGWLDEFRISKGIARWTSNFTPPKHPYGYTGNNFFSMF